MPYGHFPHKKIRQSCRLCILPAGTKHDSDTDRSHGYGSFCGGYTGNTATTRAPYCNSDGTSKNRKKKSGSYAKRKASRR